MTILLQLCLSIGCLLLLSRAIAAFGKGLSVPAVVSEILLGVFIGPTVLGACFPALSGWLFPQTGEPGHIMQMVSQWAVILLLFVAGMEVSLKDLKRASKRVFPITWGSAFLPFLAGFLLVWLVPSLFNVKPECLILLSSFVGLAFAISALPVIIRILMDIGLYRSRIGVITVSAASLMDLIGWCAFAVLLGFHQKYSLHETAHVIWSHASLLSFIAGIIVGNSPALGKRSKQLALACVIPILSPIFFVSSGAKVNFGKNLDLPLILAVFIVASFSKLLGTFIGGKLARLNGKEALAIGFALNARGAMEVILSKQALEAGLIEPRLFVALVVMAVSTSLLSAPVIKFMILNKAHKGEQYAPTFKTTAEQIPAG